MSGFRRDCRRNPSLTAGVNGLPASKRPRVGFSSTDDDDPFADDDDITGEEWEFIATQAESKLTQEQAQVQHNIPNGHSFKPPAPKTSARSGTSSNGLVKELQEKLALYENKVKELEQSYKRKDGETMVLRDRLSTTEKNLHQEKMKILEMQNSHEQAEAEREKKMQKEIEKFKDQVQFKQAEIMESQNLIRNLEARNRLLEQQKSGPRSSSASTSSFGAGKGVDSECLGSQDFNHSVAKRIKLVKPESPRVSSTTLLHPPEFNDDPLGRKKGVKQTTASPCKSSSKKAEKPCRFARKFSLKSKYISNDFSDRLTGQELLLVDSQTNNTSGKNKQTSPFLYLIDISASPECAGAMDCVRNLLACREDNKVFGNLCREMKDISHIDEAPSALLDLIETSVRAYILLQDSVSNRRMLSQDSSSFHTAQSEPNCEGTALAGKRSLPDIPKTCQMAYYALEVLDTLVAYSQKMKYCIVNHVLISNVLKICNSERWHPSMEMCEDITNLALGVIQRLAASSTASQLIRFSDFVKADILQPLLAHRSIRPKYNAITVLISLASHPPFVSTLVKEDTNSGSPSILCHICDLVCIQRPKEISYEYWLNFTQKIVTLLSVLTARHESILIEHSCFCEVYHAADILLYNQLVTWKKSSTRNLTRLQLIKSTLCLLHSCANIYSDGIPNSRRDHRHQLTLTNLEKFLAEDGDESSYWSQELGRIVKSEVKAIYEESDSS